MGMYFMYVYLLILFLLPKTIPLDRFEFCFRCFSTATTSFDSIYERCSSHGVCTADGCGISKNTTSQCRLWWRLYVYISHIAGQNTTNRFVFLSSSILSLSVWLRLGTRKTGLSPPVFLYWPFQGGTSVVVPYCYLFLLSVFILWLSCYVSDIFCKF